MPVRFTKGGAYYFSSRVWEFNLPVGHTCPSHVQSSPM